jgi:hypothetical protein
MQVGNGKVAATAGVAQPGAAARHNNDGADSGA